MGDTGVMKYNLSEMAMKMAGMGIEVYKSNKTTRERNMELGLPAQHMFKKCQKWRALLKELVAEHGVQQQLPELDSNGEIKDAERFSGLIKVAKLLERDISAILCEIMEGGFETVNKDRGWRNRMNNLNKKFNKEYSVGGDPRDKYQELFNDGFLGNKETYNYLLPLGPSDGKTTLAKQLIKMWVFDKNRDITKNIIAYLTNTNKEAIEVTTEIKKENYVSNDNVLVMNPMSVRDVLDKKYEKLKEFIDRVNIDGDNKIRKQMELKRSVVKFDEVIIPNFLHLIAESLYKKHDSGGKSEIPTSDIKKIQEMVPELYFFLMVGDQKKMISGKRVIYISNQNVYHTVCNRRHRYMQIVDLVDIAILDEAHRTFANFSTLGIIDDTNDKKNGAGDSEDLARKLSPYLKELSIVLHNGNIEAINLSNNISESISDLNKNPLGIPIKTEEFEQAVIGIFKQGYNLKLVKEYISRQHNLFQGEIEILDESYKPPSFIYMEGKAPKYTVIDKKPIYINGTKMNFGKLEGGELKRNFTTYELKDLQAFLYTAERTLVKKWERLINKYVSDPSEGWKILKRPLKKVVEIMFGTVSGAGIERFNSGKGKVQVAISHLTKTQDQSNNSSYKFSLPQHKNLMMHSEMDKIYGVRMIQLTGSHEENGLGKIRALKGKEETPLENCLELDSFGIATSAYLDYHKDRIKERSSKSKKSVCFDMGVYDYDASQETLVDSIVRVMSDYKLKTAWFVVNSGSGLVRVKEMLNRMYRADGDGSSEVIEYTKKDTDSLINAKIQSGINKGKNVFIISTLDKAEASNLIYTKNKKKYDLDCKVYLCNPSWKQSSAADIINGMDLANNLGQSLVALALDFNNNPQINDKGMKIDKTIEKIYNITNLEEHHFKNKSHIFKQSSKRLFRLPWNKTTKLIFAFSETISFLKYAVKDDKTVSGCIINEMIDNQRKLDLTPLWENTGIYLKMKKQLVDGYGFNNAEQFLDDVGLSDTIKFQCDKHGVGYADGCQKLDDKFNSISGLYKLLNLFHYEMSISSKKSKPKTFKEIILGMGGFVKSEKDLNAHKKGFKYENAYIIKYSGNGCIENKEFITDFIIKEDLSGWPEEELFDEYHELADLYLINRVDKKMVYIDLKTIGGDVDELTEQTREKFIGSVENKLSSLKHAYKIIFGREPKGDDVIFRYVYESSKKHILSKNNRVLNYDGIRIEFKSETI